uniref:NADH-ubiquinone oxidoreductase chain 2 n=1 Tax=Augocoris gomesii TaxID=2080387 RepID=A0A2K9YV10_9HEMI|nr:NADH dehydrogenase subunit 2 [Augocoris gomesii]
MNKSKSLFWLTMMNGTILVMSSNNWMSMWMGLEINMMSFIPIINNKNKTTSEAMMIYLLTQSISSMLLMFSIIMLNMTMNMMFNNIILMSLLIKLGAAPFHMWLPEIMTKMNWTSSAILLTWQKIAPMSIINNMMINNMILYFSVIISVLLGAMGGLNQMSLRKIMGYSSINHLGWMLSLSMTKSSWIMYLVIYSIMVVIMCWMFHQYNMIHINQVNNMNMTMMEKMNYIMSMMSLGGLPPFLGFLPKWMVIQNMMNNNLMMMLTIMVMSSLMSLFYYLRTMTTMMMTFSMMNKWIIMKPKSKMITIMMMVNMSLPMIMILNFI